MCLKKKATVSFRKGEILQLPPFLATKLLKVVYEQVKQINFSLVRYVFAEIQFSFSDMQYARENGIEIIAYEAKGDEESLIRTMKLARKEGLRYAFKQVRSVSVFTNLRFRFCLPELIFLAALH